MQTITMPVAPATVAAVLARSAAAGNLNRLEADLMHARSALEQGHDGGTWMEETRDLLGALAGELSISVRECRSSGRPSWDAGTFPTYLLGHVAGAGRARRRLTPIHADRN